MNERNKNYSHQLMENRKKIISFMKFLINIYIVGIYLDKINCEIAIYLFVYLESKSMNGIRLFSLK